MRRPTFAAFFIAAALPAISAALKENPSVPSREGLIAARAPAGDFEVKPFLLSTTSAADGGADQANQTPAFDRAGVDGEDNEDGYNGGYGRRLAVRDLDEEVDEDDIDDGDAEELTRRDDDGWGSDWPDGYGRLASRSPVEDSGNGWGVSPVPDAEDVVDEFALVTRGDAPWGLTADDDEDNYEDALNKRADTPRGIAAGDDGDGEHALTKRGDTPWGIVADNEEGNGDSLTKRGDTPWSIAADDGDDALPKRDPNGDTPWGIQGDGDDGQEDINVLTRRQPQGGEEELEEVDPSQIDVEELESAVQKRWAPELRPTPEWARMRYLTLKKAGEHKCLGGRARCNVARDLEDEGDDEDEVVVRRHARDWALE